VEFYFKIVTHLYREAMLGISLYSYPYSTSKNALSFLLCLCFLFNKIRHKGITGSSWKWGRDGGGEGRGGGRREI
jgi:hypothetical protein